MASVRQTYCGLISDSDDTAERVDVVYAVAGTIVLNFVDYSDCSGRIYEIGCTDLDGCGSCHDELEGIASVHYPSESDDRYIYGFGDLPYHAHGYRAYGRPGKTAGDSRQIRTLTLHVYGHAEHGVDE